MIGSCLDRQDIATSGNRELGLSMGTDTPIPDCYRVHIDRINEELTTPPHSRVALAEDIGSHVLSAHGKRIRPLFFVLSCRLCDYEGEDLYRLSTIFEYIHASSLLHDDVLDNAETRRRRPSANHLWGNHAAVLEGDFLYTKALSLALDSNSFRFLRRLTDAATEMTEGQIMELVHTDDWTVTKERYIEIIRAKTAVLISAACACGAIIAGRPGETEGHLGRFGMNAGIAFQLMDDLLDYTSSEEVLGKPVCKDVKEGKITLPLIYTLEEVQETERKELEHLSKGDRMTSAGYKNLVALVRTKGALERIRSEAEAYVDRAAECLNPLPDSFEKTQLLDLNRYIIERNY